MLNIKNVSKRCINHISTKVLDKTIDLLEENLVKSIDTIMKNKFGYFFDFISHPMKLSILIHYLSPKSYKKHIVFTSYNNNDKFGRIRSNIIMAFKVNNRNAYAYITTKGEYDCGEVATEASFFIIGKDAKKVLHEIINFDETTAPLYRLINKYKKGITTMPVLNFMVKNKEGDIFTFHNNIPIKKMEQMYIDKKNKNKILSYIKKWNDAIGVFEANCISYKIGILLYGVPGTGKTSIAKAIAHHFDYKLNVINVGDFSSHMINSINENISNENKTQIILLEDIDYIFGKRQNEQTTEEKSRTNALLQFLDGTSSCSNVIIIATTNDYESLDPAIVRDGRFDLKIHMDNIDVEVAKEMCTSFDLSTSESEELLADVSFPVNPAELQNKIIKHIFDNMRIGKEVITRVLNFKREIGYR